MAHVGALEGFFRPMETTRKVERSKKWCALTQDFTKSETRKSRAIR